MESQRSSNPFNLNDAWEPAVTIPRLEAEEELSQLFTSRPASCHIAMITGVHGSGKTLFLTTVSKRIAEDPDWTVVALHPERDLFSDLQTGLQKDKKIARFLQRSQNSQAFRENNTQVPESLYTNPPELVLEDVLRYLEKHNRKLLVTIDDVRNNPGLRLFTSIFQLLLRKGLPLFLLMAGRYDSLRALQDEESLTFLYRTPRITLGPLHYVRMTDDYQRIFQLDQKQAVQMALDTQGYPPAFQALGYYTWMYEGDPNRIQASYRRYLFEHVYETVWTEMSLTDRKFLSAMAQVPDGDPGQVRALLHMEANQFNPCRTRLTRMGTIEESPGKLLRFTLPLFEDFMKEKGFLDAATSDQTQRLRKDKR